MKDGQQASCNNTFSQSGINHMWILKNYKDLIETLKSRSFLEFSSIQMFDFSTLYTMLPHDEISFKKTKFVYLLLIQGIMLFYVTDQHMFLKHLRRLNCATWKPGL